MTVAVTCPNCRGKADFESVMAHQVPKAVRPWFRRSRAFEMRKVETLSATPPEIAVHYPRLHGLPPDNRTDLPEGVSTSRWNWHNTAWFGPRVWNQGTLICPACDTRRKHRIDWPREAWFQVEYRGRVLWAYDRSMAVRILDHVESRLRPNLPRSLRKLPSHFLTAKARPVVARRLRALLGPARGARPLRPPRRRHAR